MRFTADQWALLKLASMIHDGMSVWTHEREVLDCTNYCSVEGGIAQGRPSNLDSLEADAGVERGFMSSR